MKEIHAESLSVAPYVTICQPRRVKEETPAQNLNGYHGLHIDMNGFSHAFVDVYGQPVDVARNYLMEAALESNAKYMLFVGEDTVLPYYGFTKLHDTADKHPDSVIVGVYYIKISSPMIMIEDGEYIRPANVDPGKVFPIHSSGMDAMLIPISVLRKLKEQEPDLPFTCIANELEGIPFIGEDTFFNYRLRKAGIPLICDTDVQCLHMDLESGKYTAHPDVDLSHYLTAIPVTERLQPADKFAIDKRWVDRLPKAKQDD